MGILMALYSKDPYLVPDTWPLNLLARHDVRCLAKPAYCTTPAGSLAGTAGRLRTIKGRKACLLVFTSLLFTASPCPMQYCKRAVPDHSHSDIDPMLSSTNLHTFQRVAHHLLRFHTPGSRLLFLRLLQRRLHVQ